MTGPGTPTPTPTAVALGDQARLAHAIADRAAVDDLRSMATAAPAGYWDTRPMLDSNEHSPCWIDMAIQALQYLELRRLIARHPHDHHLVRVLREPVTLPAPLEPTA
jgi:hypothetical protein